MKCELKMDKTTNKYVREGKIRNLLKKFGLAACEHTKVSMLSGGERRKLNLATEVSRWLGGAGGMIAFNLSNSPPFHYS